VLLGTWQGANDNAPQVRYLGAGSGFFDLGMNADGNFTVEYRDTPRLTLRKNGNLDITVQFIVPIGTFTGSGFDGVVLETGGSDAPNVVFKSSAAQEWQIDQFGTGPALRFGTRNTNGTGYNTRAALQPNGNMSIDGTFSKNSDRALKTDIQPLGPALEKLLSIPAVRYQFKAGTGRSSEPQIGLIEQDVQAVFLELVSRSEDGHLSLAYSKLTAVLLQGLQEQQRQIDQLQARDEHTTALETRLATLEQAMSSMKAGFPSTSPLAAGLAGLALVAGIVLWRRHTVTA